MEPTNDIIELILKIQSKNISVLQFILEGYEGIATATTIDKKRAIVKLFIMPGFVDDVKELLGSIKTELDLQIGLSK
jgi:hypothetical protein